MAPLADAEGSPRFQDLVEQCSCLAGVVVCVLSKGVS